MALTEDRVREICSEVALQVYQQATQDTQAGIQQLRTQVQEEIVKQQQKADEFQKASVEASKQPNDKAEELKQVIQELDARAAT